MRWRLTLLIGIAALAACTLEPASAPEPAGQAPTMAHTPLRLARREPLPADQCRAFERRDWIGRSVGSLPEKPRGENWRIVCTTCQKTDDHRLDRLNIIYEELTGLVTQMTCG